MPSGGYRGELKGAGRRGPQPRVSTCAVSVGSAVRPHQNKHEERTRWWLDTEHFYELAKQKLDQKDFGYYATVPLASMTLAQVTEDRARREGKHWTPPADRQRKELPA